MGINSGVKVQCPIAENGYIYLMCRNDATVAVDSTYCGSRCSGGIYSLPIGSGLIQYGSKLHGQTSIFPCPAGYTGEMTLKCVDGKTLEADNGPTSCYSHCLGTNNLTMVMNDAMLTSLFTPKEEETDPDGRYEEYMIAFANLGHPVSY